MAHTLTTPTTTSTTPRTLGRDTVVHLGADPSTTLLAISPAFWTHEGDPSPELTEGRILCVAEYSTTWTWWERHPVGAELVYLVSGDADFELSDGERQEVVPLTPGSATVVPAGRWHRAIVRTPSRILFITPTPARTELREVDTDPVE